MGVVVHVGYINTKLYDDSWEREKAKGYADRLSLKFVEKNGDNRLLQKIVNADFDEKNFLIVQPGYQIAYSNGPERVIAVPAENKEGTSEAQ